MDHAATLAATVLRDAAGTWVLTLESSTTDVVETVPTGWDGSGRFYDEGLNNVGVLLNERGLVYTGPWTEADGTYTVMLHRRATWGPQ